MCSGEPRASALATQIGAGRHEVLGHQVSVDGILQTRALAHEERAPAQQLPATACLEIRNPDRRKELHAEQFGQLAGINRIGLRARLPDDLHMEGMCHTRAVAMLGEPWLR